MIPVERLSPIHFQLLEYIASASVVAKGDIVKRFPDIQGINSRLMELRGYVFQAPNQDGTEVYYSIYETGLAILQDYNAREEKNAKEMRKLDIRWKITTLISVAAIIISIIAIIVSLTKY